MNYLDLPVYKNHRLILSALEGSQALVVESPTGSGKTTQLPVILHEAGYSRGGIVGVTQPRRIAAVSVSEFIARQRGCPLGGEVGYKMRFEDRTGPDTKIKIMTDGILLQEMKLDPWLSKYSLLVVDEAHERSLNIDFILGLLKRVLESRREFKVVVSSATINTAVFSAYFGDCPIVRIDAQRFPVTLIYDPPAIGRPGAEGGGAGGARGGGFGGASGGGGDRGARRFGRGASDGRGFGRRDSGGASGGAMGGGFGGRGGDGRDSGSGGGRGFGGGDSAMDAIVAKVASIVGRFVGERREGDILVFLSGERMIKECMARLAEGSAGPCLHMLPLYGRLGKEEQERVFEKAPAGKTKVVLSTNIAETSVTIEGITAVIDSGLSKLNWYNPRSFTSSLVEAPVSKASANQRRGRAGRTCEGVCYRLYERGDFENRPLFTAEEIFRTDLSEVILRMADLGATDFEDFDFISAPGKEGLIAGIETLNLLGALEPDRSLSGVGRLMAEFPLAPRQSRIIVEAIMRYPDVLRETIIAAAFLSTQSPYVLPPGEEADARKAHHRFRDERGDFVSYLRLFQAYSGAPSKAGFCERSYLDERAMAEISSVTAQLEEIAASLKIPVLQGGSVDDYLCCVGRGMIQFVCAREGRGRGASYRSLTADKIIIHPGSAMFRTDPQFIVAGEIVRTSRMYAMSVSPLSREVLGRIMPGEKAWAGIFAEERRAGRRGEGRGAEDGGEGAAPRGASAKGGASKGAAAKGAASKGAAKGAAAAGKPGGLMTARDFADSVQIGGEAFEIRAVKGKKTAILPWERLSRALGLAEGGGAGGGEAALSGRRKGMYKGLKGCVAFGGLSLLAGEKLELILALAPSLDPESAAGREWPKKAFSSDRDLEALLGHMDSLARPAPWKKGSKEMGFLGLFTDGDGSYRLRCSRGFHTSLNESLASLEALIEEMGDDAGAKRAVSQAYRRLSMMISD